MRVQRLRITFERGEEVKYITHLDIMRFWERALRRAGLPLSYSEGANPTAKISLAAPLSVGATSSAELMDVYLEHRVAPIFFIKELSKQLPPGFQVLEAREIGLGLPSLQSQVRWAEYEVAVESEGRDEVAVSESISSLLAAETLPWQHRREKKVRKYDLRALIDDIQLLGVQDDAWLLAMRLRCDNQATGRPDQVVAALGFEKPPRRIQRTQLILEERNPLQQQRRRYSMYS